jgi:FkbM family methyltransferase
MYATLDNGPTVLAAYAPQPDYAEWEAWKRLLGPGSVFVDVGANVGIYTLLANEVGAQTISVEPVDENVRRLEENLGLNGYASEIWPCAACAEKTTLRFSSDQNAAMNYIGGDGSIEVRGETYDTIMGGRHARGVKVDVEGAERQVLEGARQSMANGLVDVWQLEWNEMARENFGESRDGAAAILRQYGYDLFRPTRNGLLVASDGAEGSDVFAVRPGALVPQV